MSPDVKNNDDTFWRNLRAKVGETGPPDLTPLSPQEAERRMASAGEIPLAKQRIEDIVRSATAGEANERQAAPSPRGRILRFGAWTRAAALVLGGLFLYAVSSVDIVFSDPGEHARSPLAVAVVELLDAETELQRRVIAHTQVFAFARANIRTLREVRDSDADLRDDAERHLGELRIELLSDEVPNLEDLAGTLGDLPESGGTVAERRGRLAALAQETLEAIRILKAVRDDDDVTGKLNQSRAAALQILEREIDA